MTGATLFTAERMLCRKADEQARVGRDGAADPREREEREAPEQHRTAAVAVGERAQDELPDAEGEHERRQRPLKQRGRCAERACD